MKRPSFLSSLVLIVLMAVLMMTQPDSPVHSQTAPESTETAPETVTEITNPVIEQRADPWVYLHTDGYYYFTASVPEYDRIEVRRAETIQGLASAEAVVVWRKRASGIMSQHIWAPEIHFIDGKWYIYFAAARTDAPFDHRIYVLENESANPLEGTWTERGQVVTRWETFALDATTFEHDGVRYLVWAQRDPAIRGNSNLYIAPMENPWTLAGEQVMISTPEFDWEVRGFLVNEGAAVLKRNGRIFITYSASATNAYYAMGLLTASDTSDLLNPASWNKAQEPVFRTNETTGQFGPGHNSFTVSPEGYDILIYHARNYEAIVGDPLYDPNRHMRAQRLYWNSDGTPNFGIPVPDGPLPWRFRSFAGEGEFIRHDGDQVVVNSDSTNVAASQFRVVPGLADASAVSLEAIDAPGSFLRQRDGEILLGENDGSDEFAAAATWQQRPGLAGENGVSFEAYAAPGQYLLRQDSSLSLGAPSSSGEEATFVQEY